MPIFLNMRSEFRGLPSRLHAAGPHGGVETIAWRRTTCLKHHVSKMKKERAGGTQVRGLTESLLPGIERKKTIPTTDTSNKASCY